VIDKIPPHSIDYEEAVLSACLRDDAQTVIELLSDTDFYRTANRKIFNAITDLCGLGVEVCLVSVVEKLKEAKCLDECGGASYIASLLDAPVVIDINHFCRKIKDKAIQRKLIEECNTITHLCFDDTGIEKIIDESQARLNPIFNSVIENRDSSVKSYRDLILNATDRYEELAGKAGNITGLSTGFFILDYILCGLQDSDLIILAGRPSMGKTAMALNIAGNIGKDDIAMAVFSLEMSKEQLIDRQVSGMSGVNLQKFRNGKFTKEDWVKIQEAQSKIYQWPVYIDDTAALHYREIHRRAWQLKKKYDIKAIFIDHLQLICGDKERTRDREIGTITAALKATAKELRIPVVLLSQLNRSLEARGPGKKRPTLSDLRDSGNIEQDSDVIMFLYRPAVYQEKEDYEGQTELIVAKQRNGPTGMIKLKWNAKTTQFYNIDTREAT